MCRTLLKPLVFSTFIYSILLLASFLPSQAGQDKQAEAQAYKQWYDASQAKPYSRAIELANQYIEKYPNGLYTSYLRKWVEFAQKQIEKEHADLNTRLVPLAEAAASGKTQPLESLLQSLVDEEAGVNMRITDGRTILMLAAANGRTDTVRALIEKGADVNAKEEEHGWTALIYAIWNGKAETVETLIGSGADVNVKDKDGATALEIAIIRGNPGTVKLLRKAGATQ